MAFTSYEFLIFFPIVVLAYYIIPKKLRRLWLLFSSYYFYMSWSIGYGCLLLGMTAVTYCCARGIAWCGGRDIQERRRIRMKKGCMILTAVLTFSALIFFKYSNFLSGNINTILRKLHFDGQLPMTEYMLPLGISFYTFQSFGYLMDVYRGKTEAEKNFFRYALFLSFFPTLVSGPIERSDNLLLQLKHPERTVFQADNVKRGLCLMLWGYYLKLVMADRIAIFVNSVYGRETDGIYVFIAALLYGIQIYCDFAGYSSIAIGAAKVMGFTLVENFCAPYLSFTVSEFWRKWHMSLTGWFRDYLYIPLGGSRKGRIKKYRNIMIVFLVSGLWHGAGWKYLIWGGLNGLYQVIGDLLKPLREKADAALWKRKGRTIRGILCMAGTFLLVDFAWIFFRADSTGKALGICRNILTGSHLSALSDGTLLTFGMNQAEFIFMLLTILVLFIVDLQHYRQKHILDVMQGWHWAVNTCLCAGMLMVVLIFGIYGVNYDVGTFIYFAF